MGYVSYTLDKISNIKINPDTIEITTKSGISDEYDCFIYEFRNNMFEAWDMWGDKTVQIELKSKSWREKSRKYQTLIRINGELK